MPTASLRDCKAPWPSTAPKLLTGCGAFWRRYFNVATSLRTLKLAKVFTKSFLDGRQVAGLLSADFLAALPHAPGSPRWTWTAAPSSTTAWPSRRAAAAAEVAAEWQSAADGGRTAGAAQALEDALRIVDFSTRCQQPARHPRRIRHAHCAVGLGGRCAGSRNSHSGDGRRRCARGSHSRGAGGRLLSLMSESDQLGIVKLAACCAASANSCPLLTYVTLDGCRRSRRCTSTMQ